MLEQVTGGTKELGVACGAAVMSLVYPVSTQACAAVLVAFRALHVCEEVLRSLVAEWTQMGIPEVIDLQFAYCHYHCCAQCCCTLAHQNTTHVCGLP